MTGALSETDVETERQDELAPEEIASALDYLLSHKMVFGQDFLRSHGLPFSGTKEKLRQRLEEYLAQGRLTASDLVRLLDQIEGWGDQHIYLYKADGQTIEPWLTEDSARDLLRRLGLDGQFGRRRPLVLPEGRTLASIEWTPQRVRFVWVEKQQWEERAAEQDIVDGAMVWRAYRVSITRGLMAFDWDLVSGHAMLMIRRLPHGASYDTIRDQLEAVLEPLVSLSRFERLRVSRAIQEIEESDQVRRRQVAYHTLLGGTAAFTSADRSIDTFADPDLKRAGGAIRSRKAGLLGNFYWLPVDGLLSCELHSKLYGSDQRIGIFGEHKEEDVRYVISCVRRHCR